MAGITAYCFNLFIVLLFVTMSTYWTRSSLIRSEPAVSWSSSNKNDWTWSSIKQKDQDMKFLDKYLKFEVPQCLNLIAIKVIRVSVCRLLNKDQKFLMSILKNDLAEAFIKRMKLITRVLLMKMKLPNFLHRTCHFTWCIIDLVETCWQPSILLSTTRVWEPAKHYTFTSFWLCYLCAYCTATTYWNEASLRIRHWC